MTFLNEVFWRGGISIEQIRILASILLCLLPCWSGPAFNKQWERRSFFLLTSRKGEHVMKRWKRFIAMAMVVSFVMALVPVALAEDAGKVNINKASVADLMKLKNIGQKYAERIVAYREKNGPFEKPEDITNVKGIGPKILALNKDRITVK